LLVGLSLAAAWAFTGTGEFFQTLPRPGKECLRHLAQMRRSHPTDDLPRPSALVDLSDVAAQLRFCRQHGQTSQNRRKAGL